MSIISIFALIIICVFISALFKQYKPEYSVYINLIAGAIILVSVIGSVIPFIYEIEDKLSDIGVDAEYFIVLFKALGICYITQFVGDLCKDAGQNAMESKVYLIGKSAIFILSFGLLKNLFYTAISFLG